MTKKTAYVLQEPTRKSARLAALENNAASSKPSTNKQLKTIITRGSLGHCSSTRRFRPPMPDRKTPRKCRSIQELVTITPPESPALQQDGQNSVLQERSTRNTTQQARSPPEEPLPPDNAVEMLLATLEKNDKNKLFAEPVDPKEVPDYYKIIKEPIDFATIRKKLQKGLYKSLQQFESDVFRIFDNAMKLKPSTIKFYKEAQELREEAKKAFTILRFHLKKNKARSAQRSTEQQHQYNFVIRSPGTVDSGGLSAGASYAGSSSFTKSSEGHGDIIYARRKRLGPKNSNNSTNGERRNTYRHWTPLSINNDNSNSAFNHASKVLVPANDIGLAYTESLMGFVKDLGPKAKLVANKKLKDLFQVLPHVQQEIPSHAPSQESAILAQTPLILGSDAYGHVNADSGTSGVKGLHSSSQRNVSSCADETMDIHYTILQGKGNVSMQDSFENGDTESSRNAENYCGNTELLGITLSHHLARKLHKTVKPSTAVNALGSLLSDQLMEWYMTPGKNQPGYNVQVTKLGMHAQEGFAPIESMSTMHNVKGKNILSTVDVNYEHVSSKLLGEQFPGLNAMM